MKHVFRFSFAAILALLLSARALLAQGNISIAPPAPTRITDAETGALVGPGYLAALYWAPAGTVDPDGFAQLGAARTVVNGIFPFTGNFTIPTATAGGSVNLYGAAWEGAYGNTYNEAAQVTGAKVGRTPIITTATGIPPSTVAVTIPNFSVSPVPEPSSLLFLALGFSALLAVRHRK